MSLLRPSAKITDPSGEYWEVYVSKTILPSWRAADSDIAFPEQWPTALILLWLPLIVLNFVWSCVVVPLIRAAVLLPVAVARGRRSRTIRIEALRTFPREEVLLWTTTDADVGRVLDEVVGGLAEGKIVHPEGAVYLGEE
jgi:hypothetical protein